MSGLPLVAAAPASRAARAVLELRVAEIRRLFNAMDPAPFRERDLDPNAEAYIVAWAREQPAGRPLELAVHLEQQAVDAQEAAVLREAVDDYFRLRAVATRRELRQLFRVGRISLVIGLAFLGVAIAMGEVVAGMVAKESYGSIIKESFVIGGWVALWRPLEIFLYDWWPIRAEARLYDRLGQIDVRVVDAGAP